MKKRFGLAGLIVLVVIFFLGLSWKEHRWTGQTMGTSFSVHVFLPGFLLSTNDVSFDELKKVVEQELSIINNSMSTYLPTSEISLLNAQAANQDKCIQVSEPLHETLTIAKKVHDINPLYDVTLGPLIDLWGFGGKSTVTLNWQPPANNLIEETLERVGFDLLDIGRDCVIKQADIELDLSSVAKGYAVDRIVAAFRARGVQHFLVEIGGEVFASGYKKPLRPWLDAGKWRVAVEKPIEARSELAAEPIVVADFGVATSGDYRNYLEFDQKYYTHLIDPRTGQALIYEKKPGERLRSVTVLSSSTGLADAFATGLLIAGKDLAQRISIQNKLKVLLLIESVSDEAGKSQVSYDIWRSPEFSRDAHRP